jgi:hypothetical protein
MERDVGVSDKVITRCIRFRALYPDVAKIDPTRSFDSYVAAFEGGYISKRAHRSSKCVTLASSSLGSSTKKTNL